MKIIEGGICAVDTLTASGTRKGKYGVAVIVNKESTASALFTSNKVRAAPVILTENAVKNGKISAVVVNSGNANCFTGQKGMNDAKDMAKKVAENLNIEPEDVAVASTGIIGRKLPMDTINYLIGKSIKKLENSPEASKAAAKAIMTTDTFPKEISVETELKNGTLIKIGGITKGSGMIAPNMGTMLCFVATDAKASPKELQNALKIAVEKSFNMIVIDGDESTNDTILLMAGEGSGQLDENFQEALDFVCIELAKMMVKDGEGATKYMEITLNGATSYKDAKDAARAIAGSTLVKTAIFGADPNWGRIVAAIGYSGAEMYENIIDITFKSDKFSVEIVKNGSIIASEGSKELKKAEKLMKNDEINIIVNLNLGEYSATAYGCDLSYDYVRINSEYST